MLRSRATPLVSCVAAVLAAGGALVGGSVSGAQQADDGATSAAATATSRAVVAQSPVGGSESARASCPPCGRDAASGATQRPGVSVGSGQAIAQTGARSASASAVARSVSLLDGLVTAYGARREAAATPGGPTRRSGVVEGLKVGERQIGEVTREDQVVALPDGAGTLTLNSGEDAMRVRLARSFQSLPPGSVIHIARVDAQASAAPGDASDAGDDAASERAERKRAEAARKRAAERRARASRARADARRRKAGPRGRLTRSSFAFPVYGDKARFSDDYGAPRQHTGKHEGTDIFAPWGTPAIAVADGRLEKVGTLPISGNRLWLVTERGDAFFYAHLAAFSPAAVNGRAVEAGTVLGFVGNTGDAEPTPPHVHFEVHPGGEERPAVNPYPYLRHWRKHSEVDGSGWLSRYGGAARQPGALVEVDDYIASR